jgi:AcrR family transcriptional regulator
LAEAALDELAERGYADLSHSQVAERAGVATRTAFRHFPTKLDLALAGIDRLPDYNGWLEEGDTAEERLRCGLSIGANYPERIVPVLAACVAERQREPALLEAVRERVLIPRQRSIERFLAAGIASGELNPDVTPESMAAADLGMFLLSATGALPLGKGKRRVDRAFAHLWPLIASPE